MIERRGRGRPAHNDVLTPAEWCVVEWVRHGLSDRGIARFTGVSLDAITYHTQNIRQKLGFARRVEIRRWNGVRNDSNLFKKALNLTQNLSIGTLGQIARGVRDIAASEVWYRDFLGLPHLYTFGKLAFFDMGGVRLFLSEEGGEQSAAILYFKVDDVRAAQTALEKRGVEFQGAPHLIHKHHDGTEEWMSFFKDNEGRPLALMSQVAPGLAAGCDMEKA